MGLSPAERQRAYRARRFAEIEQMPRIPCACGCSTLIPPINTNFKPARYAHGHNPDGEATRFAAGQGAWNKGKPAPWATETHRGKQLTPDEIARRTATRLQRNSGIYQAANGWKHSPETIQRMRAVNLAKAMYGSDNPAWEGGKSFEPYDAAFNSEIKAQIMRRDKGRCQDCGSRLGRRKDGRKPNIHHIDFNKSNTTAPNLVALCVPCHQRRHWEARKIGGVVTE